MEFVPLHGWLRAENDHGHYGMERDLGGTRLDVDSEASRLTDSLIDGWPLLSLAGGSEPDQRPGR